MAEPIWAGSSSFASGQTPFGFYDTDSEFVSSIDNFSNWAAKRLGFPIVSVELASGSFYACFEEAVTEYSAQVNQFNITDNLLHLQGQSTGSSLTHQNITPSMGRSIRLAEEYGTAADVGGTVPFYTGSIDITSGSQIYDIDELFTNVSASGADGIEIRRVYHGQTPAIRRFFDPYATTGYGTQNLVEGFGFGSYSPAVTFTLMPIFEDLLRVQAIELNDEIRKSAYSFQVMGSKLRIFPNPTEDFNLWFDYVKKSDVNSSTRTQYSGSLNTISDFSNVPYDNMKYSQINDVGKQWIRKFGLALARESLGSVRGKYGNIPIPNGETTLDGDALRNEAVAEKEALKAELREMLEKTSQRNLLEADRDGAQMLQEKLGKVPLPIYVG
jgi:hypothetical protein|tara:strand:- start:3765 stop:4919 length:1155 start_codon:yes stop_codon:yes gene_type:complete